MIEMGKGGKLKEYKIETWAKVGREMGEKEEREIWGKERCEGKDLRGKRQIWAGKEGGCGVETSERGDK